MDIVKQPITIADSEVIMRIKEGERELFEVLIRRNNPCLYKTGMSYGFNHHDTQDLMQDAFIAAYVNLDKFQHRSSFKTWIVKIMLNLCYRKMHTSSFKNEKPADIAFTGKTPPMFTNNQSKDVHQSAVNKELHHVIEAALVKIPMEYRMVFSLRELSGMTTAEVAEVLDITETNVKTRLSRARHMLRGIIEKMYSPEEIFEFNLIYCDKITGQVMQMINIR